MRLLAVLVGYIVVGLLFHRWLYSGPGAEDADPVPPAFTVGLWPIGAVLLVSLLLMDAVGAAFSRRATRRNRR